MAQNERLSSSRRPTRYICLFFPLRPLIITSEARTGVQRTRTTKPIAAFSDNFVSSATTRTHTHARRARKRATHTQSPPPHTHAHSSSGFRFRVTLHQISFSFVILLRIIRSFSHYSVSLARLRQDVYCTRFRIDIRHCPQPHISLYIPFNFDGATQSVSFSVALCVYVCARVSVRPFSGERHAHRRAQQRATRAENFPPSFTWIHTIFILSRFDTQSVMNTTMCII